MFFSLFDQRIGFAKPKSTQLIATLSLFFYWEIIATLCFNTHSFSFNKNILKFYFKKEKKGYSNKIKTYSQKNPVNNKKPNSLMLTSMDTRAKHGLEFSYTLERKCCDVSNVSYISTLNKRVKVGQHISWKTRILNALNIRWKYDSILIWMTALGPIDRSTPLLTPQKFQWS